MKTMDPYTPVTEVKGPKLGVRGVIVLACLILGSIPPGAVYTFGNFAPYLVSYARNRTQFTSLRNVDSLWVSTAMGMTEGLGVSLGGVINRHIGPRLSLAIGGIVYSVCTAASYFVINVSFIAFVVVFGLVGPIGGKIVYGVTLQLAMKWLPNHASLAAGLVLSGYGAAALIFNPVITAFINPDNLSPDLITDDGERYFTDADMLDRVRYCFLVLGGSYFGLHAIGVIGMSSPTVSEETKEVIILDGAKYSRKNTDTGATIAKDNDITGANTTLSDEEFVSVKEEDVEENVYKSPPSRLGVKDVIIGALRTRSFYVVWFSVFWLSWAMRFVSSLYKAYGQTFIHDDMFLALVGTLASVFNSLCRPCWGMVMDRFGYQISIRCVSLCFTVLVATFVLTENFPKGLFMAWMCATFGVYCGQWAVTPTTFAKLFSVDNMAINYGFIFLATALAGVANLVVATTLKDIIGYHGMLYLSAGLGVIPFLLMFLFNGVDAQGNRI